MRLNQTCLISRQNARAISSTAIYESVVSPLL